MIIKYMAVGLFGVILGVILMGVIFIAGNAYENSYDIHRAFRDGYEKGRKEVSNETESKV